MRSLHFAFRCRSPRKGFLPHSCGVFRRWHAPLNFGTFCPEVRSLRCFPSRGIPFRTVILFSRCRPSMNYPKSTRKNAIPGILRELHFDEVYTLEIAFLQSSCIMEVCGGGAYLWLYRNTRTADFRFMQREPHHTKELAEKIGVSASRLSRIVSGGNKNGQQ